MPERDSDSSVAVAETQDHTPAGSDPAARSFDFAKGLLGQAIGRYRILRCMGQGGMGVVFEAVHESIGQRAAVKVLHPALSQDPEVARRFHNEARAVAIAQHPGLVKIFDHGQLPSGLLYLLMEYLDGESLGARLDRSGGRLPGPDAFRLSRQIASVLAFAHGKGIVHRDLKPDNVFIVKDPEAEEGERIKVLDFGLAKIVGGDALLGPLSGAKATSSGTIMGTPAYMAPEQCRGLSNADGKADVYALGLMLYEMLAGRLPFMSENVGDLIAMHITQRPPLLSTLEPAIPRVIEELVDGMLAKRPEDRPPMEEVTARLLRITVKQSESGKELYAAEVRRRTERRTGGRGAVMVGLPLLAALLVAGLWAGRPRRQPASPALFHVPAVDVQRAVAPPAQAAAKVLWRVDSRPPQARLVRVSDHEVLGETPFRAEVPRGSGSTEVTLELAGHLSQRLSLDNAKDSEKLVALEPLPKERPPAARERRQRPRRQQDTKEARPPDRAAPLAPEAEKGSHEDVVVPAVH